MNAKRIDNAIELLQLAFAERKRVLGPQHPDTLETQNLLADAYRAKGLHQDADTLDR
jgi:gamma-glutamyltranspeptidase